MKNTKIIGNNLGKNKLIEIWEEWRKGWATPDVFVYKGRGKSRRRFYLKEHTSGEVPFIKFNYNE